MIGRVRVGARRTDGTGDSVLVVGAGLAGMTAAHHAAEWGAEVILVDSAPHIGGAFLLLDHTFTTDSCGLCLALPDQPSLCPTIATQGHPRIRSLTRTTLTALEGEPGCFTATLRSAPRYVDPERCDSCGACAAVCPVTRPQVDVSTQSCWGRFLEEGTLKQRAIYPPPPRAEPVAYAIDPDACLGLGVDPRCEACVAACPRGAIDLGASGAEETMEVGAAILAPGFTPFDAAQAFEYGYRRCTNVVTSLELERMLNRSGPTRGRVLRPSDGRVPQRVAFIHCVGSRSEALGRPYCSSSCCMITAKQVGMSHKALPGAELTVFTMDVRTTGKGYERYFERVEGLPGVAYRRGRPAAVHELPDGQDLRLLTPEGEEIFDLVVLAVGMGPAEGVEALAEAAGVTLDEHGFIVTGAGGWGSTTRRGVYCAGSGVAPADVPETVTQAAAAAALAVRGIPPHPILSAKGGGLDGRESEAGSAGSSSESAQPVGAEPLLSDAPPGIGVFLCTCHGDLDERLNFGALAGAAKMLRSVSHVERVEAACESSGLLAIERAAAEHALNRIVIAGCSPHLYEDRFEELMERLGLPPRLLARANVREGAAWPFGADGGDATGVARGAIVMAVAALRGALGRPPGQGRQESVGRVLVLGGGLAGMTAALTLAELGVACDLVEREDELGGNLRETLHTLEGVDGQALLRKTVERLQRAESVRVWTEAQLTAWSGMQGAFEAEIRVRKERREERYGALIVATGAQEAAPATTGAAREYLYGCHPRVLTQRELEQQIADGIKLDGVGPRSVVMIQCVGSRNEKHPYCSRVCCGHAIKNALALKRVDPDVDISVLYRDIRTMGTRELYYQEARQLGVRFMRYEPPWEPVVQKDGERLRVTVRDTLYDETLTLGADLLVLSTGIVPSPGNQRLAELLGVTLGEDGFFAEVHAKLRPVDLPTPGLFLCGLAYGPRFITESVSQARAAALRAALSVVRPPEPRHEIVTVEPKLCSFCGLCVTTCPYGARVLDDEERVARVIASLCQGCGACVALCPNGASRQPAFEPTRALAVVDAALE